jgi:hypothetical protein
MKALIAKLILLILVLGAGMAHSQTLDWASLTQSTIVDSQGDPLDNTFIFELGSFDTGFTPSESNHGDWAANWRVFDTADYSYDPINLGYFTGTQNVQDVPDYVNMFQGLQAYIWIHDATNTESFLASATTWTFPALDPDCCPNGEVTQWSVSNLGTDAPVWGSQLGNDGGGDYTPGFYDIQTAVPEPASSLLILFGGSLALLRRRRAIS